MISISDQLNLANIIALEPRASNVIYVGANLKIETIPEYLARVDIYNRYLGLEVIILEPNGVYTPGDFISLINTHNITYSTYKFADDLNTLILSNSAVSVINSLDSDSTTSALSAAKGKELKQLIDNIALIEIDPVFQAWLLGTPPAYPSDIPTSLSELSEDSLHRTVTDTEKSTWNSKQDSLGFTPENINNKVSTFQPTPDNSHYPTEKLVKDSLDSKVEDVIVNGVTTKAPSQNAVYDALQTKQETLQSGVNIKTINNQPILGSGNLDLSSTDEKVKFDVNDPTSGYLVDKIISGTGISIQEGVGANENKLVITNTLDTLAELGDDNTHRTVTDVEKAYWNSKSDSSHNHTGVYEPANNNIQTHIASTSNPHNTTAAQVGAYTTSQVDTLLSGKQNVLGYTPEDVNNKSTNTSLGTSDILYPTQKAVKTYVDTKIGNAVRYQGAWDASGNTYPTTGGSGVGEAIMKGDLFVISVAGVLNGIPIQIGDEIIAKVDNPGQTAINWSTFNTNISYVPEDVANKVTSISGASTDTQYPSAKLTYDQLALKENLSNKENITLDTSSTKYPTNNLVKLYADAGDKRLSTGCITMPTLIDNGNGTATVSQVDVNIFATSDFTGNMFTFTVPQATLSFTDGAEEYISVRYNSGSPIYYKETVGAEMNHSDNLPIFVVWRLGTVIHSLNFDSLGVGLANKTQSAAYHTDLYKLSTDGGLVITEVTSPAARTINVTGAIVYTGVIHQDVDVFSSATNQMTEAINTPSGWTYTDKTVYNNTQRNPGTSLTTISNNKYSVRWFYRSIGDAKQLFYVLGTGEYNSISEASFEQPRTDLPMILKHHCMLIGRAIIQHNATSGSTQSLIQRSYSFSSIINHDDTGNISLAGSGVTYGHINDQAQTLYGVKTFNTSPVFPTLAVDTNTTQAATTAFVINQGYLKSSDYTASDVLTKIKTVDGSGSGLDADLLDGIESSDFLRTTITSSLSTNKIPYWNGSTFVDSAASNITGGVQISGDLKISSSTFYYLENTSVNSGTTVLTQVLTSSDCFFFEYIIKKTTNIRAGIVIATHNGTNVSYTDFGTNDLGNTSDVVLSVDLSGGYLRLISTSASSGWTIKLTTKTF